MNIFGNMTLRIKIFVLVTSVMIVSFTAVSLLVSNRSIELARADAFSLVQEMAEKYKNEIMAELQGARVTSETLKAVLETLKSHGITDRDMMNDMLKKALEQKEYITAFCVAYEPNRLDGLDAYYAGREPYDQDGRFAPYWNKLGNSIAAEPLLDIDAQDWYIVPKATKKEYITDPYPFHVQGQDVMLASFIFPIIHEGEFIGIIASDIVLDKLQEMVSRVNTRGAGEYTEIFSNSGVVVAHPDKQYLGKTIAEKLLYDGATPDRQEYVLEVTAAIQNGEMYIYNDDAYYAVYMPIRFNPDTKPWSVAVSIPMSEVLEVSNRIRNYVLIVCAVSVGVLALIIFLISQNITKPILILAGTAKQLGEGNLNAEVPLIQNSREIALLSGAFKIMVQRIDELFKKVQNNAKELEEKNRHLNNLNNMLVATNHVAQTIMNVEHQRFQDVLYRALRLLGESTGSEVVSIWQNFTYSDGKTYGRRLSAWVFGQSHQQRSAAAIDLDELLPDWRLHTKTTDTTGAVLDGQAFLRHSDALLHNGSLFFIPLVLHDSCWGFIAFSYKAENFHLQNDASEILRSGGMMIASAIIQNRISEDLEEAEEKAATDSLTGLTNRNGFLYKAAAIFEACKEKRSPLTLLFFDLDHFKMINDRYGHPFGDEVIKAFAAKIKQESRASDVCCRYGGEEFILLQHNRDPSQGRAAGARLLESVRGIRFPDYPEFKVTVSIGMMSAVPEKQDTLDEYIQKADSALYRAKSGGRDQIAVF